MKKITCVALFSLLISTFAKAGSCSAIGTGNWETPGNWTCGHVPGAGDNVTIGAGIIITVNVNNLAVIGDLSISGTLDFTNGAKINLAAASVVNIFFGGAITGGNGGAKLVFPSTSYSGPFTTTGPYYFSNSGQGNGLLPVILASFYLAQQNQEVFLYWTTENEENINSFEIESSRDANSDWQALQEVPPMAGNASGYSYTFIDHNQLSGDRYYRLKIIDRDGKYVYSKVLFISSSQTTTFSIRPTLVVSSLNVILPTTGASVVSIFSTSGYLVKTWTAGSETFNIDVSGLSGGEYFLRASQGKNLFVTKFFKQ
ncbi:MAG: hypothetical protein C5B59_19665 [Bacteroidetes bacterium]|nr:MAG: hypothetical protein C5B59_19665 [Bacteroidota bacterium]